MQSFTRAKKCPSCSACGAGRLSILTVSKNTHGTRLYPSVGRWHPVGAPAASPTLSPTPPLATPTCSSTTIISPGAFAQVTPPPNQLTSKRQASPLMPLSARVAKQLCLEDGPAGSVVKISDDMPDYFKSFLAALNTPCVEQKTTVAGYKVALDAMCA